MFFIVFKHDMVAFVSRLKVLNRHLSRVETTRSAKDFGGAKVYIIIISLGFYRPLYSPHKCVLQVRGVQRVVLPRTVGLMILILNLITG